MKFHQEEVTLLTERLMLAFDIEEEKASGIVQTLEKALFEEDETFFLNLKYTIHFRNDPAFSQKMLRNALEIFTYLLKHPRYAPMESLLISFCHRFFDEIFIQRCRYAKKIEKRGDTAQQMLLHLSHKLDETLHTQELMIANISHDMRTSLNAISGYLILLSEKNPLQGEDAGFLEKAYHASQTLNQLVSDILDITKINSGQLETKEEYFYVDELITKCVDNFSLVLNKKQNITLELDTEFLTHQVYGNRQHIFEILANLVGNAIKYTDKGFVRLILRNIPVDDDTLKLHFRVEDTGIGMTKEQTRQIFNPYSRFKRDRQGVGLGMHIASKLAQKLDAELSVESTYGEGSRFDFIVPVQRSTDRTVDLDQRCIYLCCLTEESDIFDHRAALLKDAGAHLCTFRDEPEFINFLLTDKRYQPHIISIAAPREVYAKFDALINYLKTMEQYEKTLFIAEKTQGHISLKHFDKVYDHFAILSDYAASSRTTQASDTRMTDKTVNILVVDDMQTNLEIFYRFVNKRYPDINIDLANGGYEAIGMFKAKSYDIIFLDLKMPGLDGIEVIKRLRDIRTLPPIYALTADVYKNTYEQITKAGFTQLLEKPLQLDKLYKTIEGVIHG